MSIRSVRSSRYGWNSRNFCQSPIAFPSCGAGRHRGQVQYLGQSQITNNHIADYYFSNPYSQANSLLVVAQYKYDTPGYSTSMTWGGTSMTLAQNGSGGGYTLQIFYLANPARGSQRLLSSGGAGASNGVGLFILNGIHQTSPLAASGADGSAPLSVTLTGSVAGGILLHACVGVPFPTALRGSTYPIYDRFTTLAGYDDWLGIDYSEGASEVVTATGGGVLVATCWSPA